jgi:hypothetical protein
MSEIREIVRRLQESDQAAELTDNQTEIIRRDDAPRQHEEIDAAAHLEENLSASIRRDIPPSRHRDSEAVADPTTGHPTNGLLQQVADASVEEIDRIILELQRVRDMLRGEGERLSNEIARYATLNNMTMTVMRSVADRLKHSKGTENGNPA